MLLRATVAAAAAVSLASGCFDPACDTDTDITAGVNCDAKAAEFKRSWQCSIENDCPSEFGMNVGICIIPLAFCEQGAAFCFEESGAMVEAAEANLTSPEEWAPPTCVGDKVNECDALVPNDVSNIAADCDAFEAKMTEYRQCYSECATSEAAAGVYMGSCAVLTSFTAAVPEYQGMCNMEACFEPLEDDSSAAEHSAGIVVTAAAMMLALW